MRWWSKTNNKTWNGQSEKPHIRADSPKSKILKESNLNLIGIEQTKPFFQGSKGPPHLLSSHDKYLLQVRQNTNRCYFFLLQATMQIKKKGLN